MRKLQETQRLIIEDFEKLPFYDREHYNSIRLGNRINGIVGARGTGKTTFLLKTAIERGAKKGEALYVSADNLYFLDYKLVDLAEKIYKETDIRCLCVDEIHKYGNWNQELKNIYDMFANLTVMFSGSSMIDIVRSKYDLSRRVTLYPMYGFSFREYLDYFVDIRAPLITLEEMISDHINITNQLDSTTILKHFRDYLELGYYPFTKTLKYETEIYQAIENIVQKTIYEDISTLHNLKTPTLMLIEKLYKYVLSSSAGELNTNKLAQTVQKDFSDVSKYLLYLNQAGLIHFLHPKKSGNAALRNPTKLLPENSNLIYASYLPQTQDTLRGKIRETFFINQIANAGYQAYYSEVGDYQIEKYIFEIGGKNKTSKQIKDQKNAYILADGITVGFKNKIPLFLVGLLY